MSARPKKDYITFEDDRMDCSLLDNLEPLSALESGLYEGDDYDLKALLKEWDAMREEFDVVGEFEFIGDGRWR